MSITTRGLAAIKPGAWLTDDARKGAGRLVAYGMKAGGAAFYFRYTGPDGKRDALPMGHYDPKGKDGLSLAQASADAAALSKRYQDGERDLRAVLDAEQREAERERKDAQRAAETAAAYEQATLGALLTAYVAQLRRDGKASARQVERALEVNVEKAWPKLWTTPAADVTDDDLMTVVAKLADADKLRGAEKLRAYLRAAYSAATRARHNPRALPALRALGIRHNPAVNLSPIEGNGSGARDRNLSVSELRAYWKRIEAVPDPDGALLRFHLLTGGQRVEQLARLTVSDYDRDSETVTIKDGKGRRRVPRSHIVPLLPDAQAAMKIMRGMGLGPYLFTVTDGHAGASYHIPQHRLAQVVSAMEEAGELPGGRFTLGDLRRTVETRLAASSVSRDDRAQLQSHGLGGVQAKHYDRHDYAAEKRTALEALYRLLTGTDAKVTPIKRKKSS